jgi:hypothetical protein
MDICFYNKYLNFFNANKEKAIRSILPAFITTSFLVVIYNFNAPSLSSTDFFLAWDSYLDKDYLDPVDWNGLFVKSLALVHSTPDFYWHKFISFIYSGNISYISRTVLIFTSCFLVSELVFRKFSKNIFEILLNGLLILLIFLNIPYQWLVNDGVMYAVSAQCCYFFVAYTALYLLGHENDSYPVINAFILSNIILICGLWSFSSIVPIGIFVLLVPYTLLLNIDYKNYRLNILLNYVFLLLLGYAFYKIFKINHFDLLSIKPEEGHVLVSGGGYPNLRGGLLTQISGLTDFSMYTNWGYRVFGTMNFGFESMLPQILHVGFIAIMVSYFITAKVKRVEILGLLGCLLVSLFLSKGAQEPFGLIYYNLIHSISIFGSIRTPDTKFGVYTTLYVLIFAIYFSNKFNDLRKYFLLLLSVAYMSIAITPVLKSETTHGYIDTGGERAYVINKSLDKVLIGSIRELNEHQQRGLLVPGYGHIATPAGIIGFQDYLEIGNPLMLNYSASQTGPHGNLLTFSTSQSVSYIRLLKWMELRSVNFLVIRKSALNNMADFPLEAILADKNNLVFYDDPYSILIRVGGVAQNFPATKISNEALSMIDSAYFYRGLILLITGALLLNLLMMKFKRFG